MPPVYRIVCVHPLARRPVHQRVWAMRAAAVGGSVCLCSRSFSRSWFVCFCPSVCLSLSLVLCRRGVCVSLSLVLCRRGVCVCLSGAVLSWMCLSLSLSLHH